MSQVSHMKTDDELVTLFGKMQVLLMAIKFPDEQGRADQMELIHHCEEGLKLIKQKYNVNREPPTTLRPDEFHHQYCQCAHCDPLTGCDR